MTPRKRVAPAEPKAVGYVRVSTKDQATEGWSLDAQRRRIGAYCEARGWPLAHVYADEGVSAVKHRPQWEQLRADVLADGVSHVVALKLDRFGRSAMDLLNLYDALESKGVAIVCVDDNIDTSTPIGRMMRTVLAAMAEFERDLISERTKTGMAEKRQQAEAAGLPFKVGRPVGVPDRVAQRIVREREAGRSYPAIARGLTDDGIPTAQGGTWRPSTVQSVERRARRGVVNQ